MTSKTYTIDADAATSEDRASALAFFLLDNTGSIFGTWTGAMTASDQRSLLGGVFGDEIVIDGEAETISHNVSVSAGKRETVWAADWRQLAA
jgi:hypothetical protein